MVYKNNKRFYTLDNYFKDKFGKKVIKIALDINCTCPNRDGKKGTGGCSFCSGGSGDFAMKGNDPNEQFEKGVEFVKSKWKNCFYMPYLQSFSNTYVSVNYLKNIVDKLLKIDNVIGISIATRADCLEDDMLEYLNELNKKTYLIVEVGMQTKFNETLKRVNRCSTHEDFLKGFYALKNLNIDTCVHIINGLIGESKDMMMENAKEIVRLNPKFIKIHLMHILLDTVDYERYLRGEIKILEKSEYINLIIDQIEIMPPDMVIQRITGDGNRKTLVAPRYTLDKIGMLSSIDNQFVKRQTYQGRLFKND